VFITTTNLSNYGTVSVNARNGIGVGELHVLKAATPPSSGGTWVKTAVKRSYETSSRVEPRQSALNMTLPAAAARASAAIDRYLLHAPELSSKPAARCCCCRSMGQTDGRTDTRPLHSPCSASINVNLNLSTFTYTLKSDVDRVELFRLTLRFFDDASTAS